MRKSKSKNKPANKSLGVPDDYQDFAFWNRLAHGIMGPDAKKLDEWQINEVAVILYSTSERLREEFIGISKVCDKNEDKTISVTGGFEIDRRNSPPEISVKLFYAEKHGKQCKKKVPDPNDLGELPLTVEKGAKPITAEQPELSEGQEKESE